MRSVAAVLVQAHMLLAFLLLVVQFPSTAATGRSSPDFGNTINYQIHSNNDLRELNQLLLKGATRFKFDPHYVTSDVCKLVGVNSARGCLLLNHDNPAPKMTTSYSTSDDLIDYLKGDYFQSMRKDTTVRIALCFKSAPDKCQDTPAFNNWLSLADDFFNRAAKEVTGVEFILDGDAKPVNCLIGRWKPLNSVWINNESPQEAFLSNDEKNDYYRYQIINDPESFSNWTWMAQNDYGKFANSQYPIQLWEPDKQSDYLQYADIYESGNVHTPGFHFAINIDISMFELYLSEKTHRGAHRLIANGATQPLVAALRGDLASQHVNVVKNADGKWVYSIAHLESSSPFSLSMSDYNDLGVVGDFVAMKSTNKSLFLLSRDGLLHIFNIVVSDGKASLVLKASHKVSLDVGQFSDMEVLDFNDDNSQVRLAVASFETNRLHISNVFVNEIIDSATVIGVTVGTGNSITSMKLALQDSCGVDACKVMVFAAINDVVVMNTVDMSGASQLPAWVAVNSGRSISVSSMTDPQSNKNVIALANDFGYCYNSHKHNTRAYPLVCDSRPVPSSFVLDLSVGLTADWSQASQQSSCKADITTTISTDSVSCFMVTSCHDRILHGSMNQGSSPSIALGVAPDNSVYFVDTHSGVPTNAILGNECGEPLRYDGVVLGSLPLGHWIANLNHNVVAQK